MSNWANDMDRAMDTNPEWFGLVRDEMGNAVEPAKATGTICRCGLAESYHADRFGLARDHQYEPRYPAKPEAEMAATAGDDEPRTLSGGLSVWTRVRRALRSVLTTIRKP